MLAARSDTDGLVLSTTTDRPAARASAINRCWRRSGRLLFQRHRPATPVTAGVSSASLSSAVPSVFISYCHADKAWRVALEKGFAPAVRSGRVAVFSDSHTKSGDRWEEEIRAAMARCHAAILLVSTDFLASRFINDVELPFLLGRSERREIQLLWVPVEPSSFELSPLAKIQAAFDPARPLSTLSAARAKEALVTLVNQVVSGLDERAGGHPSTAQQPRQPEPVAREGKSNREITVQIDRSSGGFTNTYYGPGLRLAHPWSGAELDQSFSWEGQTGVPAILAWVDGWHGMVRGRASELERLRVGEVLFRMLFPTDACWEAVAATLPKANASVPAPLRHPLRLRLCTGDAALCALPWRLATWDGQRLVRFGWHIDLTLHGPDTRAVSLPAPCKLLVVAPDAARAVSESQLAALPDVLAHAWPDLGAPPPPELYRVVRTRAELEAALPGMQPAIVYFVGDVSAGDHGLTLHMDDRRSTSTDVSLASVANRSLHPRLQLFCLNYRGLPARQVTASVLRHADAPAIFLNRVDDGQSRAGPAGLEWLRRVLAEGSDPVDALHSLGREDHDLAPWSDPAILLTSYGSWSSPAEKTWRPDRLAHLRLDRDAQRALVERRVHELATSRVRRVEALVAYSGPGNLLEQLELQVLSDIVEKRVARPKQVTVPFPLGSANLRADLERSLIENCTGPGEPLKHALRRLAPNSKGMSIPLLWLGWGVLAPGSLTTDQLRDWLVFCHDCITSACPDDIRIICYVALEVGDQSLATVARFFDEETDDLRSERFRCSALPPLTSVKKNDLIDFLTDPPHPGCPAVIAREAALAIYRITGGAYEQTVQWLERAQRLGWTQFLREAKAASASDRSGDLLT
jgi:hypothetical protein